MQIIAHRIGDEDQIETFFFYDQRGRKWIFNGEKYRLEESNQTLRPEQIQWSCPELGGTIECMASNPCPKCDPTNKGPWGAANVDIDWRW